MKIGMTNHHDNYQYRSISHWFDFVRC